ncbi:MAG: heme-binding protein [Alphaproteobacteria bacterium]|nr:heme-binding protein [Alphaproteobacteria bacterium]
MASLTMKKARKIIDGALKKAREMNLRPMTFVIVDAGAHLKALMREDGTPNLGPDIGLGKAEAAVNMGRTSRELGERFGQNHGLIAALASAAGGRFLPIPGGVLIVDKNNNLLGAAAGTGDTGDNDEICIIAGVEGAGFKTKLA